MATLAATSPTARKPRTIDDRSGTTSPRHGASKSLHDSSFSSNVPTSQPPQPASNQFPIDIWYQRGNIKCKARSGALRGGRPAKNFASPMHSYTVTHRLLPQQVNPLECALTKNASANLLECSVTKSLDLKAPEMNTYKRGRGVPPASTSPLAAI